MSTLKFDDVFLKQIDKLRDEITKKRLRKQIQKVAAQPEIGKPMRYERRGMREVRIGPYRLAYI